MIAELNEKEEESKPYLSVIKCEINIRTCMIMVESESDEAIDVAVAANGPKRCPSSISIRAMISFDLNKQKNLLLLLLLFSF